MQVFWISASLCFLRAQFSRFLPHYGFCGRSFLDSCAAVFWIPASQFSWKLSAEHSRLLRSSGAAQSARCGRLTTPSSPYHTPTRKGHFHFHPLSKEVGRVGGRTPPTSHYYYLPSFGGVRTFSSSTTRLQGWKRKSIPLDRESVTVLKSNLPYSKVVNSFFNHCHCATPHPLKLVKDW